MTQIECPVCESSDCQFVDGITPKFFCEVCGQYSVSGSALAGTLDLQSHHLTAIQRAVLSVRIRQANDAGQDPPTITTYDVEKVVAAGRLPTPAQQAANIIRYVGDRVSETGKPMNDLPACFHAAVGSPNRDFALRIAKQLGMSGLITAINCGHLQSPDEIMNVDLTLAGWEQFDAEQRGQFAGRYGFIALKFGDAVLDQFLQTTIRPAVQSIGYDLVDLRDVSKAGLIDNLLRAQIRDAAFVLVDLTHDNSGAYWEAGYAEGLGKPVLYVCEKSKFDDASTHFDTNHCTTVMWSVDNPVSFTEQLVATLRRSLNLF